jgi:hypothetical protein
MRGKVNFLTPHPTLRVTLSLQERDRSACDPLKRLQTRHFSSFAILIAEGRQRMRLRNMAFILVMSLMSSCKSAPAPEAAKAPAAPVSVAEGNLAQVMRSIMFPNSNVIFYVQSNDPTKVKQAKDASEATDILASTYGGWDAVENSSLALSEAANLLMVPGRKCSNGKDVPIQNEDWPKLVQQLRDAGLVAYKAAQSKNQDNILAATDTLTTACGGCHEKYRDKPGGVANRCM